MTWIASARDCARLPAARIGGKATNLARLVAADMRVPLWFCITADAFEEFRIRAGSRADWLLQEAARKDGTASEIVSEELDQLFRGVTIAQEHASVLLDAFDCHFGSDALVAVRSSAVSEDSAGASYAGQYRTHLNVDRAHLLTCITDCLVSPFSAGCIDYRRIRGNVNDTFGCAVIVQTMVPAQASGVLFTVNPVSPDSEQLAFTAAFGRGEGVVQDLVEADTFILSRDSGAILDSKVVRKTRKVVSQQGNTGTWVVEVDAEAALKPVLDGAQLATLHGRAMALEAAFGSPQDIEWAIAPDGSLHFLQARPITTLRPRPLHVFDGNNISENYRGATTPLTYSYVRKYYEDIFVSVATMFGTPVRALRIEATAFRNLVGFVDGGLYYNLENWYRMFHVVPGFGYFARAFEHGVGLEGVPAQLREQVGKFSALRQTGALRALSTHARILVNYASLPWRIAALKKRFVRCRRMLETRQLPSLGLDQLADLFERVQVDLCPRWGAPLLNDYYAFIFFHGMDHLAGKWGFDPDKTLVSDILRAEEDLSSVAPIEAILALARTARETPGLVQLMLDGGPGNYEAIRAEAGFSRFVAELDAYISDFGDRRFDELKLESPTLRETPEVVLSLLRNYVRGSKTDIVHGKFLDRDDARELAWKGIAKRLAGHPLRRLAVSILAAATRKSLAYREFGRLIRSQRCGLERSILMQMAARLTDAGAMDTPSDICFLTLEEIAAYAAGSSVTRVLQPLIAHRREEFAQHERAPHPLRIVRSTPIYSHSPAAPAAGPRASYVGSARLTLTGLGCSPGSAHGRARIVHDPRAVEIQPGDILVTRSTDPAWAFLMAAASALVVERGNLLSHAAIIGRELGIPCVIGVDDATSRIAEESYLHVDGSAGMVQVEPASVATSPRSETEGSHV
jgi:rifampicin phosphotransferase